MALVANVRLKLRVMEGLNLTVTFAVGTDIDMATVQVQNRVNIANSSLPNPVVVQGITVQKQSTDIVLFLTLVSTDSIYDALYLNNYATLNFSDELTRLQIGRAHV